MRYYPAWTKWPSKITVQISYGDEHMTLCSKAMELAHLKGKKSSHMTRILDRLFWFEPNHCHDSYLHYRLQRLNRHLRGDF